MEAKLTQIENTAVDIMATFTPWLAPIPSAWLIGRATMEYLGWHWIIAVVAGVAVECIGVVSIVLALRLHEWNQTRRQSDPTAPVWLALTAVTFYFIVTICLTVLLDVFPAMAQFAPAIFPLLAAVGAVNIAIKRGQNHREATRAKQKEDKKTAKVTPKVSERKQEGTSQPAFTDWRKIPLTARQEMVGMSPVEIQNVYGVRERTAQNWAKNARELSPKVSENGHKEAT